MVSQRPPPSGPIDSKHLSENEGFSGLQVDTLFSRAEPGGGGKTNRYQG